MVKWRGPDKLTFSNRAERAAYIEAHPVPDKWEQKNRLTFEGEHAFDNGHQKITREYKGRPLRWCVTCSVPLFLGWYCGAPCESKKKETCRQFRYIEGTLCRVHDPETGKKMQTKIRQGVQKKLGYDQL